MLDRMFLRFPAAPGTFTYRAGTIVYGTNSTLAVTLPTGIVAGDLILIVGLIQDPTRVGTATGYTNQVVAGDYATQLRKTAVGTESGTTVTVSFGGAVTANLQAYAIRYSSGVTPLVTKGVGNFAVNPTLTLSAPSGSYTQTSHLVHYRDNADINITGLNANLTQLGYRTTSHGMWSGWIDTSALNLVGSTISVNSNGNQLTGVRFAIYV